MEMEQIVEKLERERKAIHKIKLVGYVCILIGGYLLFWTGLKWYLSVICIIVGLGIKSHSTKKKEDYIEAYKNELVTEILKEEFEDVVFKPHMGVSKEQIDRGSLGDYGNKMVSKHAFEGSYKGIPFLFSHLTCIEQSKKKGEVREKTLFEGNWISFGLGKEFTGEVQIHRIIELNYKSYLEKIEFEDVKFNKEFKTYATDAHLAFYLITPPMMEKIKKLGDRSFISTLDLDLCFENGCLHTMIKSLEMNAFEPNIYSKINLEKAKEKVIGGVSAIKDYVDVLGLDSWGYKALETKIN